jgi:hypothetical protein
MLQITSHFIIFSRSNTNSLIKFHSLLISRKIPWRKGKNSRYEFQRNWLDYPRPWKPFIWSNFAEILDRYVGSHNFDHIFPLFLFIATIFSFKVLLFSPT